MTTSIRYVRNKRQGLRHRTVLRVLVLPTLRVGQPVPCSKLLARLLRIAPSEAWRHMRRVLDEDGIRTETRGSYGDRRCYVVEIPVMRAAA